MKKTNRNQNLLIVGLLLVIFTMSVGFAGFTQRFIVNEKSNVLSNWNIGFEKVIPSTICHGNDVVACGTVLGFKTQDKALTLNTKLINSGDIITYTVKVKNYGDVDAKIGPNGIKMTPTNTNSVIAYNQSGLNVGKILKAGETFDFTINVSIPISAQTIDSSKLTNSLTFYIDWIQE